jgi:hypothetical protein
MLHHEFHRNIIERILCPKTELRFDKKGSYEQTQALNFVLDCC